MVSICSSVTVDRAVGIPDSGDQAVYVLELSKELARLGHAVDIWTRRAGNDPETETVVDGVRIIRVPCSGHGAMQKEQLQAVMGMWLMGALHFIEQHGFDYDFIASHHWISGIAGHGLAAALRVPHLHVPHSLGVWKMRQMEADFPDRRQELEMLYNLTVREEQERKLAHSADMVIGTTPAQIDILQEDYNVWGDKLHMVPPGCAQTRFFPVESRDREAIRKRMGFKGNVVLAIGRPARDKGYDILILAFLDVVVKVPDTQLYLVVGNGECSDHERQVLAECRERVIQLGLEKRVIFTGSIAAEDLPDLYRAADVFVLPSRYEPFGMAALEAMACGTPVVATTRGGFWQAFSHGVNVMFADTAQPAQLSSAIAEVLSSPQLKERLSQRGAETARHTFSWSAAAEHFVFALEQCRHDDGVSLESASPADARRAACGC